MSFKDQKDKSLAIVSVEPVDDSMDSTNITSSQDGADIEKHSDCNAIDRPLTHYVVPVLDKGVKTALKQPTSSWVRFRVWYNPYRTVRAFACGHPSPR